MKTIIVPVDFSKESMLGIEMAMKFAQKVNTNIQMVYVQKKSEDYRPGTLKEEQKFAEGEFEKLIKKYKPDLKFNSELKYIIKQGKIYQEIVEQAESFKDSMIVASTHGASGFEEYFIGSNSYKIITSTRNSVITVRKKVPSEIKRIVAPLRLHVDTRQKVPVAAEMADLFGAEIHLISVSTTNNKKDAARLKSYLNQSAAYLRRKGHKPVIKDLHGESTVTTTINYCNAVDADLLTITSSQRANIAVLTGSFAQQLVAKSDIPVLSITAKEKHVPSGFATGGYR